MAARNFAAEAKLCKVSLRGWVVSSSLFFFFFCFTVLPPWSMWVSLFGWAFWVWSYTRKTQSSTMWFQIPGNHPDSPHGPAWGRFKPLCIPVRRGRSSPWSLPHRGLGPPRRWRRSARSGSQAAGSWASGKFRPGFRCLTARTTPSLNPGVPHLKVGNLRLGLPCSQKVNPGSAYSDRSVPAKAVIKVLYLGIP